MPAQQVPDKSSWSGMANAVPSGLYAGVAGMANAPTALWNLGARGVSALGGPDLSLQPPININPTNYQPHGTPERAMYAGAQAVGSLPSMAVGGEVAAPLLRAGGALAARAVPEVAAPYVSGAANTAANAAQSFADMPKNPVGIVPRTAFVGGAAGQAASENVPEPYKDLVNVGANLAAGGGLAAAETALGAGGRAAARTLGNAGIGTKQAFGAGDDAVRAAQAQADVVAARLAQAAGPEGRAALMNPSAPDEMVPGAMPTTAQVAPTPGMVGLDKAHRVATPEPFNQRAQDQNSARLGSINGLAPADARPGSVGEYFAQQLDQLDQQGQASIAAARQGVQGASNVLSGFGTPAGYGADARGMLETANSSAQAQERRLWQAVDPDGTLALPATPIRQTAQQLLGKVNPQVGDVLSAPEQALLHGAAGLPDVIKFSDLSSLRSNISAAQRQLAPAVGWDSRPMRRLDMLKSSVDGAIADGVNAAADSNPAVVSSLQGIADQSRVGQQAVAATDAGGTGVGANIVGRSAAPPGVPGGAYGANRSATGAVGGVAGDQGVSGSTPALALNFDQDAANRYAAARQATLDRKQTYRTGTVGQVLKPGQGGASYGVADANVASRFLNGQPTEPARVQEFIQAAGGGDQASRVMREALVSDLRQKGIVQEDGTIKPAAFDAWQQRHAGTIQQFQGLGDQFRNVRAAQDSLNDATARHQQALADFQKSAAGHFIHDDPAVAVRRAFGSGNPAVTFQQLAGAVRGNADAEGGLKRAVVDYILERAHSSSPAAGGEDFLRADTFRKWIRTHSAPLKTLFGGQGVQNLDMVAADLRRGQYSGVSAPGSPTATYANAVKRRGLVPGGHGGSVGTLMQTLVGEHLGELVGGHGVIGAVALPALGMAAHSMRQAGVQTVNDLERLAMLHPNVARSLLARVNTNGRVGKLAQGQLAKAVQGTLAANAMQRMQQQPAN
jgi:hypothetical protein